MQLRVQYNLQQRFVVPSQWKQNMTTRITTLLAIVVGLFASQACSSTAQAELFGLFGHHRRCCSPATTTYRPVFAYRPAVAYRPAATCCPTTAQYVPQTSYRMQVVNVPVTSYRPIVTANPCTGCATTTLRPVTGYVSQVQYAPVTTYRPACNSCGVSSCGGHCAASPCSSCGTNCGGACGVAAFSPIATPSCCASTVQASATTVVPAVPNTQHVPSIVPNTQPPANPVPQTGTPQTYKSEQPIDGGIQPIPDNKINGASGSNTTPRLIDPDNRTAQVSPFRTAVAGPNEVKRSIMHTTFAQETTKVDDGGWRASK